MCGEIPLPKVRVGQAELREAGAQTAALREPAPLALDAVEQASVLASSAQLAHELAACSGFGARVRPTDAGFFADEARPFLLVEALLGAPRLEIASSAEPEALAKLFHCALQERAVELDPGVHRLVDGVRTPGCSPVRRPIVTLELQLLDERIAGITPGLRGFYL